VVFDLGGVLIDWNPRHLYRGLFDEEAAMERFLAEVCTQDWNERQDAGRSWAEAVAELCARHPDHRDLIEAYDARWPEMVRGAIGGTVGVLAELREAGTPLFALSNWSAEKFPLMRARFDFLGWFEHVVLSGEVGLIKPDPRIFELLLARVGRDAGACVYIDDVDGNVEAARRLGLDAVPFRSPDQLRGELVRRGLLGG
ncbi:MAG TPA: HAD family phosphatase, partial [Geminicoccaceae bacterium]|nr:HAD family phosphatase [Geminicoccaceae bacterium]